MPAWDASVSRGGPGRPFFIGGKTEAGKGDLSCAGRLSRKAKQEGGHTDTAELLIVKGADVVPPGVAPTRSVRGRREKEV